MKPKSVNWLIACATVTCLCCAQKAAASGAFDTARFGSEDGHAAGATPFALYYNPAAMALTDKLHVAANLTLAWRGASYDRTQTTSADPPDAMGANLGAAKVSDLLAVPAAAASYRIGDFVLGAGVFIPLGAQQTWSGGGASYPPYPGTRDGSARWHFLEGGTASLYASLGASYTIQPIRLSFGVSANFVHNTLEFTRALNGSGDDNITTEGRSYLDVASFTGSFGLGVLWEVLAKKAWLGLSYQAPPGLYRDIAMDGKVRTLLGGVTPNETQVSLKQSMPDIIRFALRIRPTERYELRLFGDVTRWSNLERQCLVSKGGDCGLNRDGSLSENSEVVLNQPRNWKNSFGLRVGGSYYFSPTWEGFAGVGYDGNAIPAGTLDASFVDGHDFIYTLGARARFADMAAVLAAFSYQHALERDTRGKGRFDAYPPPSRLPNNSGVYNHQVAILNLMVEFYMR